MNDRERFLACVSGKPADRPPYWIFWPPWARARVRWEREGMPEEARDLKRFFGSDEPPHHLPVNCGPCPPIARQVLEEDDDYVVFTDSWGIKRRDYKHGESMSEFLEFPVKDRKDWEQFREERLDPEHPERLAGNWRELAAEWMERGIPIQLGQYPDTSVFGSVRWLLGDEECLIAFYTMPDVVREIMERMTDIFITVFAEVVKVARVDVIHIWEDMCGRQGPLISPQHWEEFMGPCYRRIRDFARQHDIPAISVDTDGDPELIIPPMLRNGVNYLYPFEVAAGCDVNEARQRYPELVMMGGIDKRALAVGPEAIDRELQRVRPAVEKGRYIPELDHLVPDDVSWKNYCHYAKGLRKLVGKE